MNCSKAEKPLNYVRRAVDNFRYEADAIVVGDRRYFDFMLLMQMIGDNNYFVTRIKDNTLYQSIIKKC